MSEPKNELADNNLPFLSRLRILCGYVENGSDRTVAVFEDDATKDWVVRTGARRYSATSMEAAFEQAFQDPKNNPFA